MRHRSCEAIELPYAHKIEPSLMSVGHQAIQFWPTVLRTRDTGIHVLSGDCPTATLAVFAHLAKLHFGTLPVADRAYPCVDRCAHCSTSFCSKLAACVAFRPYVRSPAMPLP